MRTGVLVPEVAASIQTVLRCRARALPLDVVSVPDQICHLGPGVDVCVLVGVAVAVALAVPLIRKARRCPATRSVRRSAGEANPSQTRNS